MNPPKKYAPLTAAILIAATVLPFSFAQETEVKPSRKVFPKVAQEESDQLILRLKALIIAPLNQQQKLKHEFSRTIPRVSTSYDLVESTSDGASKHRTFTVVQKDVSNFPKQGDAKLEPKSKDLFKLRHHLVSDHTQVHFKGEWVSLEQHPILKSLTKIKPATITP